MKHTKHTKEERERRIREIMEMYGKSHVEATFIYRIIIGEIDGDIMMEGEPHPYELLGKGAIRGPGIDEEEE
ncbi:MAG: hypothetical protein GX552_16665 [Chloroflexi bacterium]|jgi:hypothetical protein|nr:hypothetical protein [Chloroflexota bacterium]